MCVLHINFYEQNMCGACNKWSGGRGFSLVKGWWFEFKNMRFLAAYSTLHHMYILYDGIKVQPYPNRCF